MAKLLAVPLAVLMLAQLVWEHLLLALAKRLNCALFLPFPLLLASPASLAQSKAQLPKE